MSRNACAVVRMEEMYLRLTIEYDNLDYKKQIETAVSNTEKKLNLKPTVVNRTISDVAGNFSIEFNVECENREAGEFFEVVMKDLGIERCD